jgi:putative two-component system response regulator
MAATCSISLILIVDDEPSGRRALESLLLGQGYGLAFACNGSEGLSLAKRLEPDLIVLDVMMPEMDGLEYLRVVRGNPRLAEIPIILLTALDDRSSRLAGLEAGADDYIVKPFDRIELRTRIRTIIRLNRFRKLQQALSLLQDAYEATLEGWVRALDLREHELEGHSQRVAEMTVRLARELRIDPDELVHIHRGALLHDIGKIAIPDAILRKAGPLSESEWEIMRRHPEYARSMLEPIAYLRPALLIPYCHHERWDGKGYPRGLKGQEIPRAARIFTAVDVWDALISDRPYRIRWEGEQVRSYLRANAGVIFDPEVVTTFLEILGSEAPLASDLVSAALSVTPAVGMGSDVMHAGLDDVRAERLVNGTISESRLDPACSQFLTSSHESQTLYNGPHVSLPAQAACLHLSRDEGRQLLPDPGSSN